MSAAFIARRILAVLFFAAALVLAVQSIADLNRIKGLKTDLAEIHNVRYGLLDADQWVERISAVMQRRIESFQLTDANRPQIREAVEQALTVLINQLEQYLKERNKRSGGSWTDRIRGALQQGIQDMVIDFDDLREKLPEYADIVVDELAKPQSRRQIQAQLLSFMQGAADSTFGRMDRSRLDALYAGHACPDPETCSVEIESRIHALERPTHYRLGALAAVVTLLFALCLTAPPARSGPTQYPALDQFKLLLLVGATLILLVGGILTPMIEIEARITELSLQLMGEPIRFTDQVLYFQTKSVFDVVSILARTGKADMILVAVLIVLFSVIFPALKTIATFLYYYDVLGWRRNGLIHFFALRSGKWSMADVLVIATFMAYIGFSGLVGSQLAGLARAGRSGGSVDVLTTNGTILAPGFYLFLGFVLLSLLLSTVVEKQIGEGHST